MSQGKKAVLYPLAERTDCELFFAASDNLTICIHLNCILSKVRDANEVAHTIGSHESIAEGPWPESAQHTTSPGCMSCTHSRQDLGGERSEGVF